MSISTRPMFFGAQVKLVSTAGLKEANDSVRSGTVLACEGDPESNSGASRMAERVRSRKRGLRTSECA